MGASNSSAREVAARLEALRSDEELATVRKRLAPDEAAFGLRMRDLFDVAEAHTDLPLDEVAEGFAIATRLADDADPIVHKAVGIFLKHAGTRDSASLHRFLAQQAATMPRPALRLAVAKLDPAARTPYLS